jgi:hypothetical protein
MSKEQLSIKGAIVTAVDLYAALEPLITSDLNVQYIYINGEQVTLTVEQIEETLTDGSTVQDIYITVED